MGLRESRIRNVLDQVIQFVGVFPNPAMASVVLVAHFPNKTYSDGSPDKSCGYQDNELTRAMFGIGSHLSKAYSFSPTERGNPAQSLEQAAAHTYSAWTVARQNGMTLPKRGYDALARFGNDELIAFKNDKLSQLVKLAGKNFDLENLNGHGADARSLVSQAYVVLYALGGGHKTHAGRLEKFLR